MTGFANVEHGVENFFSKLWLSLSPTTQALIEGAGQAAEQVAVNAGTAAFSAGVAANASGGDVKDAAIKGAEGSLKTVGVTIGTDELEKLGTIVTHALGANLGTAPPPPSAQ